MKGKIIRVFIVTMVVVTIGVLTTGMPVQAQTINIKFAGLLPPGTTYVAPVDEWGKLVEERTKGQVKFTAYHAQTLGKYTEFPKMAKGGLCDMFFAGGSTPSFELLGVFELPTSLASMRVSMDLINTIYSMGLLSSMFEDNGFKPMFFMNSYPRVLFFRNKRVTKMDDLKGLKIRGMSPVHIEVAKALGATAVGVSSPDLFMALDRGTVDGILNITDGIWALKLEDTLKYCLYMPLTCDVTVNAMSLKTWNSLPGDVKAVIEDINNEMQWRYIEQWAPEEEDFERLRKIGIEVIHPSPEEKAAMRNAVKPVAKEWLNGMEKRGLDAKKIVDEIDRIITQYCNQ